MGWAEYVPGFGRKPKGRSQLGRPRRKWEHNIKIVFQEVGWDID
jgi:hypothetical protein